MFRQNNAILRERIYFFVDIMILNSITLFLRILLIIEYNHTIRHCSYWIYTCLLLCYMFIWLVPHLYQINGMWNKWNEMKHIQNFTVWTYQSTGQPWNMETLSELSCHTSDWGKIEKNFIPEIKQLCIIMVTQWSINILHRQIFNILSQKWFNTSSYTTCTLLRQQGLLILWLGDV
jgi:hypothetical protein